MDNARFNPFIRACSAFGAVFSLLMSVAGVLSIFISYGGVMSTLLTLTKTFFVVYLAWCFWCVFKFDENPFKLSPFSKF